MMKFALSTRYLIITSAFSAVFFNASAMATMQPLTFSAEPTFPQVVNRNATYMLNYTITNNLSSITLPVSFASSVSAGTLTPADSSTCGATLDAKQSCSKSFLFTAPATGQTVTGSTTVNYGGRYPLTSAINLLIPSTSISANVANALFSFSDSNPIGTMGTGKSTIEITNNEAVSANGITAVTPLPTGVTLQSNTCGSTLLSSATCQLTFVTANTPDATQTISIKGNNTNIIALPIAPLSIHVYSSPVNPSPSNASFMLVDGCSTPELLTVTNNTASSITNITATQSGLTGITTNVTTCPATLLQNQTCLIGVSTNTATAGNSGNIVLGWNGLAAKGAIFTGIEANNASMPSISTPSNPVTVFGGYVYDKDTACNLVKVSALTDQYTGTGSVAWTTPAYQTVSVPNLGSSASGATSTTDGQTNTTAIVFQATPGTAYGAGLCAQHVENQAGNLYVNWYLPSSGELNAVYISLKNGDGAINGFIDADYLASTEHSASFGSDQHFYAPASGFPYDKVQTNAHVRCVRTLTY